MKKVLAAALAILLSFSPVLSADYYFSDCDYDPRLPGCFILDPTGASGFTCAEIASGDACNGGEPPIASACRCPYVPDLLGACETWYAMQVPGTKENPWCLSPESGASMKRVSFAAMSDAGAGSALTDELAAGDTVYLCAGACDGIDTRTFYIEASASTSHASCTNGSKPVFWLPQADGTDASAAIRIVPYCGSPGACETVIFTSDANGDGIAQSTEPSTFMANAKSASTLFTDMGWITIDGDPMNTGTPHIKFSNWGQLNNNSMFAFDCTDAGGGDPDGDGVDNFTLRGVEIDGFGLEGWSGLSMYDSGCVRGNRAGNGGFVFKMNDVGGPVTLEHNRYKNICGMVTRFNNNPDPAAVFNVTDSYAENGYTFSNDHDFQGPFPAVDGGATFNYQRLTLVDWVGGLTGEQNSSNWNVTDNDISCSGTRRMNDYPNGPCFYGISYNDGDTPMCSSPGEPGCFADNVLIARNVIRGPSAVSSVLGGMASGIQFYATNDSGIFSDVVIENNTITGIFPPWSSGTSSCSAQSDPLFSRAAIGVCTPTEGVIARNNTLWGGMLGFLLSGGPVELVSNLVGGFSQSEITAFQPAISSVLTNNIFYDPNNPVCWDSVIYACANVGPGFNDGGARTLNACPTTAPSFSNQANPVLNWDAHLIVSDISGAFNGDPGCLGSTTDRESEERPWPWGGSCDIGADEVVPVVPGPPPPEIPKRPADPVRVP